MTKFETMDKMHTNFVTLSDQELMDMEGGAFLTATIAGVAVWKILGGAGLVAAGGAAGYFINK